MQKKCRSCGSDYADDALKFCLQCGTLLDNIEAETMPLRQANTTNPGASPFPTQEAANDNYSTQPFGQNIPNNFNQANQWTPPPAPMASWQNQGLGQNTPFMSPMMAGQNQTLAVVSLCLGIASVTVGWCCSLGLLLSPAALITGFIALSQIKKNPQINGGRGLAIGGIATGAVFLSVYVVIIVIYIIAIIAGSLAK